MDMTTESCRKFVEVLASDAPAPGGGGAAALVGGHALLLVPALLCLGAGLLFLLPDRRKSRRARGKYAQGRGRGKE